MSFCRCFVTFVAILCLWVVGMCVFVVVLCLPEVILCCYNRFLSLCDIFPSFCTRFTNCPIRSISSRGSGLTPLACSVIHSYINLWPSICPGPRPESGPCTSTTDSGCYLPVLVDSQKIFCVYNRTGPDVEVEWSDSNVGQTWGQGSRHILSQKRTQISGRLPVVVQHQRSDRVQNRGQSSLRVRDERIYSEGGQHLTPALTWSTTSCSPMINQRNELVWRKHRLSPRDQLLYFVDLPPCPLLQPALALCSLYSAQQLLFFIVVQ